MIRYDSRDLPRPDSDPELDTPSYIKIQVLENTPIKQNAEEKN